MNARELALLTALVPVVGLAAMVVGHFADAHPLSLAVMAAEPALWVLFSVGAAAAVLEGRWGLSLLCVWSLASVMVLLRRPVQPIDPVSEPLFWQMELDECRSRLRNPEGELRVATFNTAGHEDAEASVQAILDLDAQVVVLQEVRGFAFLDRLVMAAPGSAAVWEESWAGFGTGIFVRSGSFLSCQGRQTAVMELPAEEGRRAIGVLALAQVDGVGVLPVLGFHMDRPASFGDIAGWSEILMQSGERIAAGARGVDLPSLVVAGDSNSHGTFRVFQGLVLGSGLSSARPRATWPARLGPAPGLPLYQLDRLWYGPSWRGTGSEAVSTGTSDHLAFKVSLRPQERARSVR